MSEGPPASFDPALGKHDGTVEMHRSAMEEQNRALEECPSAISSSNGVIPSCDNSLESPKVPLNQEMALPKLDSASCESHIIPELLFKYRSVSLANFHCSRQSRISERPPAIS